MTIYSIGALLVQIVLAFCDDHGASVTVAVWSIKRNGIALASDSVVAFLYPAVHQSYNRALRLGTLHAEQQLCCYSFFGQTEEQWPE